MLPRAFHLLIPSAALLIGGLFVAGGCGRSNDDYVPSTDSARRALIAALDSWQRGEPPRRIGTSPAIQVGDAHRQAGQKLLEYQVLGELPVSDGRRFAVRLKLDAPAAEEKVNYLVIGIDPLWIFREEDYRMATHWEHNMPSPAASPPKTGDTQ